MKLEGFIGPSYLLDSANVDAQRCVNLYPETIESGAGKEAQVAYLRMTPGLELIAHVGNGPIRLVHVDSIGRIFVVSGNQIFSLSKRADTRFIFTPTPPGAMSFANTAVNTTSNQFTITAHVFFTGLHVRYTGVGTAPTPITTGVDYYVIRIDANTVQLATSLENALAGTAIDISATGNSTHTLTPQAYVSLTGVKYVEINFVNSSFKKTAHGYPNGLAVVFKASGQYPAAISVGTTYYVAKRTTDTFQVASSLANALAGTAIALTDVTDAWNVTLMGADGEYGGAAVVLGASSGTAKASSMSFGGDGTDSSTIFVDGSNNYLLKDDAGVQTLGILGQIDVAQSIFNINTDITVESTENVDSLVATAQIAIGANGSNIVAATGQIVINFGISTVDATGVETYFVDVWLHSGQTLTTAELVTYLNSGYASGKTIVANDYTHVSSIVGNTITPLDVGALSFSGGDTQDVMSAFHPEVLQAFTRVTHSGAGFGSVPTATQIVWSDGYFILNEAGTNRFWVSDLQGFNVNALSFASSEGSPDILLALAVTNRYLYALNEKTTEVYADTGNADFPFERIQGGLIEIGLAAAYSVAKVGSVLCWLGRTAEGRGIIYAADGSQPRRISTHAIEHAIAGYADPSTAKGFSYQQGGHPFYVLSFDEATWVYDFSTSLWHERAYMNSGVLERHRAEYYARDIRRDLHLVSDYETNELYQLKDGVYTDNGDAITRLRSSPHASSGLNRVFFSRFQLDMETGIGLDGAVQGSNPTVMLDWSNDGGHTWSSESWALADAGSGQIGDFRKRVIWRRLGSARDRIFRVKITDPVKVVLIGAYVDATPGES